MKSVQFFSCNALIPYRQLAALGVVLAAVLCGQLLLTSPAQAAVSWDAGGGSQWWFDSTNWSDNAIPPNNASGSVTDIQINSGTFTGDLGEGIVFDPDNDPFYAAAQSLTYPAGYGPQDFYRLYIARNTPEENLLTIKSGNMTLDSTVIIGRSGSTLEDENEGRVVQTGGSVSLPASTLDIGQRESSGWGNGVWDYRGGILEVQQVSGSGGIRLSAGSNSNGGGGAGTFIMRNPTTAGHVRTFDFNVATFGGPAGGNVDLDPDGIETGVGIVEFHYENGGTRPIQVDRNLSINNGLDDDTFGVRSSRLTLVVDETVSLVDGVPNDIGLFDVNFNGIFGGVINGVGDLDGDTNFTNDRVFSKADGSGAYREGDTISSSFGGVRYDWTISYTGDISWTNADDGVVGTILGAGNGSDVVLMGLGSEAVGLAGDFNDDSKVDGADFLLWQRGGSPNGNGSGSGDLAAWEAAYGSGASAAPVASVVPEPSSLLLCLAGMSVLFGTRRNSIGRKV